MKVCIGISVSIPHIKGGSESPFRIGPIVFHCHQVCAETG